MGLYEIKRLPHIKGNNRARRQPTDWEETFTNYTFGKGLISRIYTQKLNAKTSKDQVIWSIKGQMNWTVFKRRNTNRQWIYEKGFAILSHPGKANKIYIRIPSHPSQNRDRPENNNKNTGKTVRGKEPLYNHYRGQYGGSSKNK